MIKNFIWKLQLLRIIKPRNNIRYRTHDKKFNLKKQTAPYPAPSQVIADSCLTVGENWQDQPSGDNRSGIADAVLHQLATPHGPDPALLAGPQGQDYYDDGQEDNHSAKDHENQ